MAQHDLDQTMSTVGLSARLSPWAQWRGALALLLAAAAALVAAFYPTVEHMVSIWYVSSSFNHCFLILPIVCYVIWERRADFALLAPRPSWWGVGWVAVAALVWMLGNFINAAVLEHTGVVLMLMGLALAVFGARAVRAGLFPFFYLLLMIPFGSFLSPILQDITANTVIHLLQLLDVPVYSDGLYFMLPSGNFEVAEACSGIKYQTAMFALGLLYANLMYRAFWRRAAFMALAIIVPIVMNGIRAFGIMYISYVTDNRIDIAHNHITYGQVLFGAAMLGLMWFGQSFSDAPRAPVVTAAAGPAAPPLRRWLGVAAAALAVLIAAPFYAHLSAPPAMAAGAGAPLKPPALLDWTQAGTGMEKPDFVGADGQVWATYLRKAEAIDLFLAWYNPVRDTGEPVHFGNSFYDSHEWTRLKTEAGLATILGRTAGVQVIRLKGNATDRMLWTWYWVDGHLTPYDWMEKLYIAQARFAGRRPAAAAVMLRTDYLERPEAAMARLADFAARLPSPPAIAAGQQE